MKNLLKHLRNPLNYWKTLDEAGKCPQCGCDRFKIVIEEKVVNPLNLPELFNLKASKRAVIVCVACRKRLYNEDFVNAGT